jgi:hypothetical protein
MIVVRDAFQIEDEAGERRDQEARPAGRFVPWSISRARRGGNGCRLAHLGLPAARTLDILGPPA